MGSKRPHKDEEEENPDRLPKFTISGFYGNSRPSVSASQVREKVIRVSKAAKLMEESPLPSVYNPGVLGPPTAWKTFCRQLEAIKYAQLHCNGMMVFSFEGDAVGNNGKRNYVVCHPRLMWLRLNERRPSKRCSYEVIQEGSVCKLYFDLEFSYLYNQDKNGSSMTGTFIKIVIYFLQKEFGVSCTRKNIVDLCSSTFLKFSRHLIFNLPNVTFATNIHVGNFVMMVCSKIREWNKQYSDEVLEVSADDVKTLFVDDYKKNSSLFCDEGVYTKNRNFRVLHSTKRGKNTPLIIATENQYTPVCSQNLGKDEQFFLDSLITTVDGNVKVLTYGESNQNTCQMEGLSKMSDHKFGMDGHNSSPYLEIDRHVQSAVHPGLIRCWFYFAQSELLVYEVARNRYCYNIGREHKSNGIMYVVNLKTGTYYQKCHDPDCKGFRSMEWHLPEDTLFWKSLKEDEMISLVQSCVDFSDGEDDFLLSVAAKAELEERAKSDEELCTLANRLEMWDNLDAVSSRSSSSFSGSQQSSQNLSQNSQASNPWDRLSQLSTPDSSYFASLSQMSLIGSDPLLNDCKSIRHLPSGTSSMSSNLPDIDSDDEYAKAAEKIEQEVLKHEANNSEVEFSGFE